MPANYDKTAPSAGWYPDPAHSAQLRYWDGHTWTNRLEYTSPAGEPQFDFAVDGTIIQVHHYA